MSDSSPETTQVACLTPPGAAAIAVLALRGPRAWSVVRSRFQPHPKAQVELPAEPEAGRFWLGRLGEGVSDEVVISVQALDPAPYVEVHCHGGRQVVDMLLELFEKQGLERCSWEDFHRLTTRDPLQAAAAIALAAALTVRTAAILLDQYQGAFRHTLEAIQTARGRAEVTEADRLLQELMHYIAVGRHLTVPWRVVVAGAPNVGKSSLINALAGFQRCIVSPTPGTTRDLVTTLIAVEGWPVELADTAGLRDEGSALEQQGIQLARTAAQTADLCLWVLDASAPPVWPSDSLPVRFVVNKVDLPSVWDLTRVPDAVQVSARTGAGLTELCQALARWLVPDEPPAGAAVPFSPELCALVEAAWRHRTAGNDAEVGQVLESLGQHGR